MKVKSKYTKTFVCHDLSDTKRKEVYGFAKKLLEIRNMISVEICDNLMYFMGLTKSEFITFMRHKHSGTIHSNFDNQLYSDVYTTYDNKFKAVQRKIEFDRIEITGYDYYKRVTGKKKKGDLKKIIYKKSKTKLTSVLTFLSRYGRENTLDYLRERIESGVEIPDNQRKLYKTILEYCERYTLERLMGLAMSRRNRVITKYTEKPIEFTKLTFRGRSRLSENVLSYNTNFDSVINSFISLSWLNRGERLVLPVRYSKDWHGNMENYFKPNNLEYTMTFDKGKVKINLCIDGTRDYPDNKENYLGVDVNMKHNLFTTSDGVMFDYDRKLLYELAEILAVVDEHKKKDKDYKVGKKRQREIDAIRGKIKHSNDKVCADLCRHAVVNGFDHIVMEDLGHGFGKSFVKDQNNHDLKYNRIIKEMKLCSKDSDVERIARKYGIAVSTVHAAYTSQECSECGHVATENRPNQETFDCINCGHKDNADNNSAKTIKNRVDSTVLRHHLLKQTKIDNGTWEPKPMKRERIKDFLLSYRHNPSIDGQGQEQTLYKFVHV